MYQKVENRALFAKKSSAARDKLMQMGGINPQQAGIASMQGMAPRPSAPGPSGIMASSPELMQAAMRKAPVLPMQQGMAPQQPAPMPAPQPMPLPPSQPIPNIAGIPPVPTNQAPRPQPQKPGVRKMAEGGEPMRGRFGAPKDFKSAYEFGQKAATTADPRELGIPAEAAENVKRLAKQNEKDPESVGKALVKEIVPNDQRTGDTKKDLIKAAEASGITDVPASATVDQLNKAIAGATMGAAIAGSYVNPNTGQELRPTAGARIGQAAAQGLMLQRETAQQREAADQAMKLARAKAAGKSASTKLSDREKRLLDMFEERVNANEDPSKVAAKFNEEFGEGIGDQLLAYYAAAAPAAQTETPMTTIEKARYAISQGANREEVIKRLEEFGIDPGDL